MLPLSALRTALRSCNKEALWKPAHAEGILCVPLRDEGMSGGVEVPSYRARHVFQGIAIAVNQTRRVEVGDLISADMGRIEEVTTAAGERLAYTMERMLSAVDEEFHAR